MFEPWIGKNYSTQSTFPKTLILGESHYGRHHEGSYALEKKTILCIEDQIVHNCTYRFFTRLVSSLTGRRPSFADKGVFWNKVTYHNLITEPLEASRQQPSAVQWQKSIETLPGIISSIKPEYCIVVGYRMWQRIHNEFDFTMVSADNEVGPKGIVFSPSMKCYFHGIKHPSGRGFINAEWTTWVNNFVTQQWPGRSFLHNQQNN